MYARHASETSPRVNVVVTLEEAKRRIRELGLPMLELEGDYEDVARPEIDFDSPEAMEASYGGYLSIPNLTATYGTEFRLFFVH